ncbi:unnamed protein product [Mycena citricolor]|uniref:Uncharacterized protein n=1 Tax=Mycena citricolor TaxID=2018698 RepID=A0AAD2K2W9_9AGAR|nr:unnamed protein product [Mycena citricolor]
MSSRFIPHNTLNLALCALLGAFCALSYRKYASYSAPLREPDVTVVLLNWARFANVQTIVAGLCGPSLDDVVKEIFVWNNNPNHTVEVEEFAPCPARKLRVYNSPENLYFQARFIACSKASTVFCFIQDDDYIVKPEIIRAVSSRIADQDIFLNPPEERLSSQWLSIMSPPTTFGFSWLGYGSMLLRRHAAAFLQLMDDLQMPDEERKMADNYYTILRNRMPEIWVGSAHPLTNESAFTVGEEGQARNRDHINRAVRYLDTLVANRTERPYFSLSFTTPEPRTLVHTPCQTGTCVVETTIRSLPETVSKYPLAQDIFKREAELTSLSAAAGSDISPFSQAVDSDMATFFRSAGDARAGDSILLDNLDVVSTMVDWVWMVDPSTALAIQSTPLSVSKNGLEWTTTPITPNCLASGAGIVECHFTSGLPARYLRIKLSSNWTSPWCIYETWLQIAT